MMPPSSTTRMVAVSSINRLIHFFIEHPREQFARGAKIARHPVENQSLAETSAYSLPTASTTQLAMWEGEAPAEPRNSNSTARREPRPPALLARHHKWSNFCLP